MKIIILASALLAVFSNHFDGCGNSKPTVAHSTPAMFKGNFADDYGSKYYIDDTIWKHGSSYKYRIIAWDTVNQYAVVRNDIKNPTEGGLYSRMDYMQFSNMEPYLWGFCMIIYDAKSAEEAIAKAAADRNNPKKGCNGYPFTRMKRIE